MGAPAPVSLVADQQGGSEQALADVAQRFEALFIGFMLKSARSEMSAGELLEGKHTRTYQEMLDRQWAQIVSASGSMGIAELLVRQLGPAQSSDSPEGKPAGVPARSAATQPQPDVALPVNIGPRRSRAVGTQPSSNDATVDAQDIEGPHKFVSRLWDSATQAARQLGVVPQVLIAQAALETGWGRSLPRLEQGGSSFNLFSIKAQKGWHGSRATVTTMEFMDGMAIKVKAQFRAYESYRESFQDYVNLLQSSKRYRSALEVVDDPAAFLQSLQNAGYATDPQYAHKIRSILEGAGLREAVQEHLRGLSAGAEGGRSVSSNAVSGTTGARG